MKLFAPRYYNDFKCIADKCNHTCCVGWEIDIDGDTIKKYDSLSSEYGKIIEKSISRNGTPYFRLESGEICPHLNPSGLCNIIIHEGEEYLCDICREHPRFYNYTISGKEVGLGASCEEACRIILLSDSYDDIIEIGECFGEAEKFEFDALKHRARIYQILKDGSLSHGDKLNKIYTEYDVSPSFYEDGDWCELLSSLEYLDDAHTALFSNYSSDITIGKNFEKELERFLAYLIYRHCSEAFYFDEFFIGLGFALFCERLLASMINYDGSQSVFEYARIISEEIEYSEDNTEMIKDQFNI